VVTAAFASTCRSELLDLPVRDHDYDGIGWTQLDPKRSRCRSSEHVNWSRW
jgi:hypothetical protein